MNKLILGIGLLQVIAMSGAHADDAAELHQNIHDMRILMEQSNAQAEYESRKAVIGLYAGGSKNAPRNLRNAQDHQPVFPAIRNPDALFRRRG